MSDLDPSQAASVEDLARYLRQLHIQADRPSLRLLEDRTKHVNGLFPGTRVQRVPLRRSTVGDLLKGQKFPRKGFLLTFVEACGVDLEADRRWEQAWDRLAQIHDRDRETYIQRVQRELDELRRQLAAAERRAEAAEAETDKALSVLRASEAARLQETQLTVVEPPQAAGGSRRTHLLTEVVRITHSIPNRQKADVLGRLTEALAVTDPDRAERIAKSIPDENRRADVLAWLAQATAAADSERAERIVRSIPDGPRKADVLAFLAEVTVAADPERAVWFAAAAGKAVRSIPAEDQRSAILARLAEATAAAAPDHAERIAQSIPDVLRKCRVLATLAEGAADPDHAERIAQSIPDEDQRADTLARLAQATKAADPGRATLFAIAAEKATQSIPDGLRKADVLARLAEATAAADPGRATLFAVAAEKSYPVHP